MLLVGLEFGCVRPLSHYPDAWVGESHILILLLEKLNTVHDHSIVKFTLDAAQKQIILRVFSRTFGCWNISSLNVKLLLWKVDFLIFRLCFVKYLKTIFCWEGWPGTFMNIYYICERLLEVRSMIVHMLQVSSTSYDQLINQSSLQ